MKEMWLEKRGTYLMSTLVLLLFLGLGFLFARVTTISGEEARTLARTTASQGLRAGKEAGFPVGEKAGLADGARLGMRQGEVFGREKGSEDGWRDLQEQVRLLQERRSRLHGSGGVLVVGDSLEVLTIPYLEKKLRGIPLTTNAVGGYNSMQIYDLFRNSYTPEHSVIVFDAGTNDNPNYPQILAEQLRKVRETVGPKRCLVLPTIYGYTVGGADSSGKNQVLRQVKREHRAVYLPDWARIATTRPNLMIDELHPNPEGANLRATLIARAVRKCLDRGIGDDPVVSDEALGVSSQEN